MKTIPFIVICETIISCRHSIFVNLYRLGVLISLFHLEKCNLLNLFPSKLDDAFAVIIYNTYLTGGDFPKCNFVSRQKILQLQNRC